MNGDNASGTLPAGGASSESGSDVANISDVSDAGSVAEREPSESGSVPDAPDSTSSESTSAAVPASVTANETGERHHAASTDGDRKPDGYRGTGSTADWIREISNRMSILVDFLKSQGATDADLEAMKPFLENQRFAGKLESEIAAKSEYEKKYSEVSGRVNEFESERNKAIAERDDAARKESELRAWWDTQASPAVEKIRQEALRETQKRASYEATLSKMKELYGIELPDGVTVTDNNSGISTIPTSVSGTGAANNPTPQPRQDLPDLSRYVTMDVLQQQADMVGDAITLAQDLSFEHTQLFGNNKPINFAELRRKAKEERQDLRSIWERDYGVQSRRSEIRASEEAAAAKARAEELEAARTEGYQKGLSQVSNPMTRSIDAGPSRFGVAFSQRDTTGKPWEPAFKAGREQNRLEKVIGSLAKQGSA